MSHDIDDIYNATVANETHGDDLQRQVNDLQRQINHLALLIPTTVTPREPHIHKDGGKCYDPVCQRARLPPWWPGEPPSPPADERSCPACNDSGYSDNPAIPCEAPGCTAVPSPPVPEPRLMQALAAQGAVDSKTIKELRSALAIIINDYELALEYVPYSLPVAPTQRLAAAKLLVAKGRS